MTTSPATSFQASQATKGPVLTEPQMKVAAKLNWLIVNDPFFKNFELVSIDYQTFERQEKRANGEAKIYRPDILLQDKLSWLRYAFEVMGEGSSSDDAIRHRFFIEHGIIPYYVENDDAKHALNFVMRDFKLRAKILRSLLL